MKYKIVLFLFFVLISFASFSQDKATTENTKKASPIVEEGLTKVNIMYPFSEGKTFDMEYYKNSHMPMVAGYLGTNLVKYSIEKGLASGIPGTPLPYLAIGTFYIKNLKAYQDAIAPNRDAIRADFPNYTNIIPVILVSEVVK